MAFPTPKELLFRILLVAAVGLFVYFTTEYINERKAAERRAAQLTSPAPTLPVSEPQTVPGFDPSELTAKDEGIVTTHKALAKLAKEPDEDMVPPTFYSDMDGEERDAVDSVYDQIWLDTEKRTGVNYKQITIEDIYRIDNPTFDPAGMNSYEAYVIVKNKCQIVSFSINFQNSVPFRILGDRPCTTGKVDQSGE